MAASLPRRWRAGAAGLAAAALGVGLLPSSAAAHGAASDAFVKAAYYTQWSVYGGFTVSKVVANGDASHLNQINYAFINVAPNSAVPGAPIECVSGDPWADYQMPFGGSTGRPSVDGSADDWSGLQGNFKQLLELKKQFPGIRILASLGGYSWSGYFSDAALTAAGREHLVASCVDMLINGNLPGLPAGAAKGVFDGIDVDWEFPGAAGASTINGNGNPTARPEDTKTFTLLLAEFRRQLDDAARANHHRRYLLTAALSANPSKIALLQVRTISRILDQLDVMDYDFHGPWEAHGPTDFQSELYPSAAEAAAVGAANQFSVDGSIEAFLAAGADRRKLLVGVPFYGHGWVGVPDGGTHGLYQPASGPATLNGGSPTWAQLSTLGFTPYRDPTT
ncbi:MAG: hypothetical protein K6T28_10115, partial [Acidothermus sp.]|nr:hypothetical protein [Acidothermus sp.]